MASFSFDLKPGHSQGPLGVRMIEQVLRWCGDESADCAQQIADQVLALVKDGHTERDFQKWCVSLESPQAAKNFSKQWTSLLFSSLAMHIHSEGHRNDYLKSTEVFPLWGIDCLTRYCASHNALDGFTARFDDPVWQEIYPPNGWLCGCSIVPMMASEFNKRHKFANQVPVEMRTICTEWLWARPDRILKML